MRDCAERRPEAAFVEVVRRDIDLIQLSLSNLRGVTHESIDAVSLEMGRRIAARLLQRPDLLRVAHENLGRWNRLNADAASLVRCYAEWREILSRPLDEICSLLSSDTEESRRLRQNSPFAGVLSAREVWELKQSFRDATTAT